MLMTVMLKNALFTGYSLALLLTGVPAFADAQAARAHLLAGDYDAAIETSLSTPTPESYIVAADADPENTEALIQYALALGFETRSSGIMKAWLGKMPQKSKAAIDVAYAAAPDDPRTAALIGAWHLGIVRKAGEKRAGKMFNASTERGIEFYDNAAARAPDDIVIAGNYAISLLGIDPELYKDRAKILLTAIKNTSPKNAVETEVQRRMVPLIEFLESPDAMIAAVEGLMNDPVEE